MNWGIGVALFGMGWSLGSLFTIWHLRRFIRKQGQAADARVIRIARSLADLDRRLRDLQ